MAKRTASEIYASLRQAGFAAPRAVLMTAIALAESGGDDAAVGDVNLQTSTWGPSYGLYQIRTLKAQTGTGQDRDISALADSDVRQALAALHISDGGQDLTPWSVYTSGKYQQYLAQAQAAAGADAGVETTMVGTTTSVGGTISDFIRGTRGAMISALFLGLGVALIVAGSVLAVRPAAQRANAATATARSAVAEVV